MGRTERRAFSLGLLLLCIVQSVTARAWVFHEHVEIGRQAIEQLTVSEREKLEALWSLAVLAVNTDGLCRHAEGRTERDAERCIDAAMLPAIAADHSCSPQNLMAIVHGESFIKAVVGMARSNKRALDNANTEDERLDEWTAGHALMQTVDPDYMDRATVSGAHFVTPRDVVGTVSPRSRPLALTLPEYLARVITPGQETNAIGLYVLYHTAALELAAGLGSAQEEQLSTDVARVLMVEAFAQHFLEDAFAAGHIVGLGETDGERMGTHDHYCSHGIEVRTWREPRDDQYVAFGDAHMVPIDSEHAAKAVTDSWTQVLAAAPSSLFGGPEEGASPATSPQPPALQGTVALDPELFALADFSACTEPWIPPGIRARASKYWHKLLLVVAHTPQPAVDDERSAPPRFTKEQGFFINFVAGAGGDFSFGGYGNPSGWPTVAGIQTVGVGLGYDVTGYLSRAHDSAYWLQFRTVSMGQQARLDGPFEEQALIQRRMGIEVRLRAPFAYIPGDGLVALPFLLLAPRIGVPWGLAAARGELWMQGRGKIGQFILGREVAVRYLFGGKLGSSKRADDYDSNVTAWQLDLPVADFRLFRSFEKDLALGVLMQAGVGLDFNEVGMGYRIFFTLGFDARLYPIP